MISYEIVCIQKSKGILPGNQKITHIGYRDGQSKQIITIQQAIQMITNKQCTFYVKDQITQKTINVIVVNLGYGILTPNDAYLRTIANGIETDNLEQLPEC
ncbi:DUF3892 domain-containing protein [Legionella bozemanae]|uniref:DUF3892 domain-containing protein n=1 Tax=Legionella bozemanae TaxID=447 RepID=UPI00104143EF|nr:DUF3892 domain-containing protein [Legionella bozemanae]